MIEMSIDSIRVSLMNYQRVVILKEKEPNRYLPIWIGPNEADAIAVKLQDIELARPLTHDLLQSVITTLGASVNYIIVNELQNDTFYAKLSITLDGSELEIDSRPREVLHYLSGQSISDSRRQSNSIQRQHQACPAGAPEDTIYCIYCLLL